MNETFNFGNSFRNTNYGGNKFLKIKAYGGISNINDNST